MLKHWSQFVPNYVNPTSEDIKLYIIIDSIPLVELQVLR